LREILKGATILNLSPFSGEDRWFYNGDAGLGQFVIQIPLMLLLL
jgi:hypothetical protein